MTDPYAATSGDTSDFESVASAPYVQLTQARASLSQAAEALGTPDDQGRYPIVVVVRQGRRFQLEMLAVAAVIAAGVIALPVGPILTIIGIVVAVGVVFAGSSRAVFVPIPEGTKGVLTRAGKLYKIAVPGVQRVPPNIRCSHVVSIREVPFTAFSRSVPTADDVRVDVQILVTFRIDDAAKFVYNTTAPDFDAVCQGAGQTAIRLAVRGIESSRVLDLASTESEALRQAIADQLDQYGVIVTRTLIVRVDPPVNFLTTLEARRLAVLQTSEQEQQFGLNRRIQADRETLAKEQTQSRLARKLERVRLAAQVKQLETELDADREALRLSRLQERLAAYPAAAQWVWASEKLDVARALAGNSRAMVQLGGSGDIADVIVRRALMEDDPGEPAAQAPAAEETAPAPGPATIA